MGRPKAQPASEGLTLRRLNLKFERLRQRVEDLEDLRDLNEAIARNDGKPGTPWSEVKKGLGL